MFDDFIKLAQTNLILLVVTPALLSSPSCQKIRHLFENMAFFSLGLILKNIAICLHKDHKLNFLLQIPGAVVGLWYFFAFVCSKLFSHGPTV